MRLRIVDLGRQRGVSLRNLLGRFEHGRWGRDGRREANAMSQTFSPRWGIECSPKFNRNDSCQGPIMRAPIGAIQLVSLLELDLNALVALNNSHAVELSWVEKPQFENMILNAVYARGVAPAKAFLIALDQTALYDNVNFLWFRARYGNFIYVDRIVVDCAFRGQGVARALYEDLFEFARSQWQSLIVCEVNADPPNPASDLFHRRLGFKHVGEGPIPSGKRVQYLAKHI
jgi:predicted GNAT superfamily acetyltransferase